MKNHRQDALKRKQIDTSNMHISDKVKTDIAIAGFNRIADRRRHFLQRIIWILLVCSSTIIVGFVLHGRIKYYMSDPMIIDMKISTPHELETPKITICTSFKKDYIPESILNTTLEWSIFQNLMVFSGKKVYPKFKMNATKSSMKTYDWHQFLDKLWPEFDPPKCYYVTSMASGTYAKCSATDFQPDRFTDLYLDSIRMPCYSIHNSSWKFDGRDGLFYLSLNQSIRGHYVTYYVVAHQKEEIANVYSDSVKVYKLDADSNNKYILLLTRRDLILASKNCYNSNGRKLKFFTDYSCGRCYAECFANFTLQPANCGCYVATPLEKFSSEDVCLPQDWLPCFNTKMQVFKHQKIYERCNCKPLCQQELYQISIQSSRTKTKGKK